MPRQVRTKEVDQLSDDDSSTDSVDTQEVKAFEWLKALEGFKVAFEVNRDKSPHRRKWLDWEKLDEYMHEYEEPTRFQTGSSHDSEDTEGHDISDMARHKKYLVGGSGCSFEKLSESLGPDSSRLLSALCLKVNSREMLKGRKVQRMDHLCRGVPGNLVEENWRNDEGSEDMHSIPTSFWKDPARRPLEDVAPRIKNHGASKLLHFFGKPRTAKVDIYWCPLKFPAEDMSDFLIFVVELCECPATDIFETPLGQVMCQEAWRRNITGFWSRRAVDLLTVTMLIVIGMHSRISYVANEKHQASAPPVLAVGILTGVNLFNVFLCIVEVRACWILFGNVRHVARSFIVFNWFLEIGIFIVCLRLHFSRHTLEAHKTDTESNVFQQSTATMILHHPIMIASLIIVKWCQILQKMISIDLFIDSAVPAWEAVTSRASGSFMVFLFSSIVGTIFAYFSLPRSAWWSDEVFPDWSNSTAMDFWMDDVRYAVSSAIGLTLLSDWDMDGIEGRTKSFSLSRKKNNTFTVTSSKYEGEVEQLHDDLPLLVLANAFVFAVLVLNLYIGILSDEYSSAKQRLVELKGRHRITSSLPGLLLQYWLGTYRCRTSTSRAVAISKDCKEGFWFALPREKAASADSNRDFDDASQSVCSHHQR